MLAASRAGILPFFWLACAVVYWWAKRDFGGRTAVLALFLFTMLPPVLAHAGQATTDMALTAGMGAVFLAGRRWLESPAPGNAALFGAAGALAILSKFSSLVFFPAVTVAILAWHFAWLRPRLGEYAGTARRLLPSLGMAAAVCVVLVWAGYRFSFGKLPFGEARLPAPEFFAGIRQVFEHNQQGHPSYLLGRLSATGFWNFYLVGLAVKTPIAFLILTGAGVAAAWRQWRKQFAAAIPIAFAAGVLAIGIASRINIGIRHILPIYMAFAILAALGLEDLLERQLPKGLGIAAGVLVLWLAFSSGRAHPDYLPYFNEFAGEHPEAILVDSDLDWGQDMKRLQRRLALGGAKVLTFTQTISGFLQEEQGFPLIRPSNPRTPLAGWNAVGLTCWKAFRLNEKNPNEPVWPDMMPPQEIVGKSVYLWYFPPSTGLPLVDPDAR
jgi:4-amino-4-deoxy-L-arabinose transferase-like glycosyltransferase